MMDDKTGLSRRDRAALAAAEAARVKVVRQGQAWRFLGDQIDILAARPGYVTLADLVPDDAGEYRGLRRGR